MVIIHASFIYKKIYHKTVSIPLFANIFVVSVLLTKKKREYKNQLVHFDAVANEKKRKKEVHTRGTILSW